MKTEASQDSHFVHLTLRNNGFARDGWWADGAWLLGGKKEGAQTGRACLGVPGPCGNGGGVSFALLTTTARCAAHANVTPWTCKMRAAG